MNANNATPESKPDSLVNKLHAEWVAKGSPKPDGAAAKKLMAAFKDAETKLEAADAAYIKAQRAVSEAVSAIVLARGKGRIEHAGRKLTPMSRGGTMYFRDETAKDVESFG